MVKAEEREEEGDGSFFNSHCKFLFSPFMPKGGGGVLHYKRLMGMCCWMGRIFNRVTTMGGIQNGKILGLKKSEICCLLNLSISSH